MCKLNMRRFGRYGRGHHFFAMSMLGALWLLLASPGVGAQQIKLTDRPETYRSPAEISQSMQHLYNVLISISTDTTQLMPEALLLCQNRKDAEEQQQCLQWVVEQVEKDVEQSPIELSLRTDMNGQIENAVTVFNEVFDKYHSLLSELKKRSPESLTVQMMDELTAQYLSVQLERRKVADVIYQRLVELQMRYYQRPVLTVSGGTSMGNYQAGFLYYYTYFLQKKNELVKNWQDSPFTLDHSGAYRVITGASAGAVNTFLAAMSSCQKPISVPEESPFYSAWIPLELWTEDGLLQADKITGISLLSRGPMDAAIDRMLKIYWNNQKMWIDEECRVDFGISVTRTENRSIVVGQNGMNDEQPGDSHLRIPRQTEHFLFSLQKAKHEKAGAIYNLRPGPQASKNTTETNPNLLLNRLYPQLPAEEGEPVSMVDFMNVVKASSAFPIAFEPVPIRHYTFDVKGNPKEQVSYFVDGGFFDNVPVGTAVRLNRWNARKTMNGFGQEPSVYLTMDLGTEAWTRCTVSHHDDCIPPVQSPEGSGAAPVPQLEKDLIPYSFGFLGQFFNAARSSELFATTQMLSDGMGEQQNDRIVVTQRRAPAASAQYQNFLGFFEKDFRIFDFHLGMADALAFVQEQHEEVWQLMSKKDELAGVQSELLSCIVDYADKTNGFFDASVAVAGPNGILSCNQYVCGNQSGDCPYARGCTKDSCEDAEDDSESFISRTNQIALLQTAAEYKYWTRQQSYAETKQAQKWFSLLYKNGYVYREFCDGERLNAKQALLRFRTAVQDVVNKAATQQDSTPLKAVVSVLGKTGANFLDYLNPRFIIDLALHTDRGAELGFGLAPKRSRWWRLRLANRFYKIGQKYRSSDGESSTGMTFAPLLYGVFTAVGKPVGQWELFLGGGYLFRLASQDNRHYVGGQFLTEAGTSLVFMQRLFLTVNYTYFVQNCKNKDSCSLYSDAYKDSTDSTFSRSWALNAMIGVRMLW